MDDARCIPTVDQDGNAFGQQEAIVVNEGWNFRERIDVKIFRSTIFRSLDFNEVDVQIIRLSYSSNSSSAWITLCHK